MRRRIYQYFMQGDAEQQDQVRCTAYKLKGWWEKFRRAMGGQRTAEAERNALTEEYMQYVDEAPALRLTTRLPLPGHVMTRRRRQPNSESGRLYSHDAGPGHETGGACSPAGCTLGSMDDRLESVVEDGPGGRAPGTDSREHRCERRTPGRTEGSDKENDTDGLKERKWMPWQY